jgi:hypothetical protein
VNSVDPKLAVEDDLVAEWRIYEDTEQNRRALLFVTTAVALSMVTDLGDFALTPG